MVRCHGYLFYLMFYLTRSISQQLLNALDTMDTMDRTHVVHQQVLDGQAPAGKHGATSECNRQAKPMGTLVEKICKAMVRIGTALDLTAHRAHASTMPYS